MQMYSQIWYINVKYSTRLTVRGELCCEPVNSYHPDLIFDPGGLSRIIPKADWEVPKP
jgi:hypothetical protein